MSSTYVDPTEMHREFHYTNNVSGMSYLFQKEPSYLGQPIMPKWKNDLLI